MKKLWLLGLVFLLCIASAFAHDDLVYNATQYNNVTANILEGELNATYWYDADVINISEIVGAPAFDFRFNFTGMGIGTTDYIYFNFETIYIGNPAHEVLFQFWNYSANGWSSLSDIPSGTAFLNYTLYAKANDSKSDGIIMTRFYHTSPGNTNHWLSIDKLSATESETIPPQTEVYVTGTCPINDIQTTMLYIFIGIIILVFGIMAERSDVPGLALVAGLVTMVYSAPLYSCNLIYGLLLTFIGFIYIMWGLKWKWQ